MDDQSLGKEEKARVRAVTGRELLWKPKQNLKSDGLQRGKENDVEEFSIS